MLFQNFNLPSLARSGDICLQSVRINLEVIATLPAAFEYVVHIWRARYVICLSLRNSSNPRA